MRRYSHHGKKHSRVYNIWCGIISRCLNPNDAAYPNYGGRGIGVCADWRDFIGFYAAMGDPPEGASIDRIDNDRGYEPGNCRWATRKEQNRNRRNVHYLTVDGERRSMGEWAELTGLSVKTISFRLKLGWSDEAAVKTPKVSDRKGKPRGYRWADPKGSADLPRAYRGLTPEQVEVVRATPKTYGSGRALARRFGVSDAAISAVRLTIKHFDGEQGAGGANNPARDAA